MIDTGGWPGIVGVASGDTGERVNREKEMKGMTKRQFCRKGQHDCIPAVTLTFDGGTRRGHWCAEHASDADAYRATADRFQASVTVPGYLPMVDEPHVFDSAAEAWGWLRDQRVNDLDDPMNDESDDEDECLVEIESMMDLDVRGAVYGRTPGYDGDHDLGIFYLVDEVRHADYPHEPGRLHDCALCESRCFCTGDPGHMPCVFCGSEKLSDS